MKELNSLEEKSGIRFSNRELLERVFVHRSYLNENRGTVMEHNERLEFLGDAVLELCVTEYLYKNFSDPEGYLTNLRSALVKGEMLAKVAEKYDFGSYLLLSRGEERSGGKNKQLLLANAFEAFIGAVYLEKGYAAAYSFVVKVLIPELEKIMQEEAHIDPKSRFQELSQEKLSITPTYRVLKDTGPDHDKTFTVGAFLNEELVGQGLGSSKQRAQTEAARDALLNKEKWLR